MQTLTFSMSIDFEEQEIAPELFMRIKKLQVREGSIRADASHLADVVELLESLISIDRRARACRSTEEEDED